MTPSFFHNRQKKAMERLNQLRPHWTKPEQIKALNEIQDALTDNLILVGTLEKYNLLSEKKEDLSNEKTSNQ